MGSLQGFKGFSSSKVSSLDLFWMEESTRLLCEKVERGKHHHFAPAGQCRGKAGKAGEVSRMPAPRFRIFQRRNVF